MGTDAFGRGNGLTTLPLEQPTTFFNGARLRWRSFRPWPSPSHRAECANREASLSTDGSPGLLATYWAGSPGLGLVWVDSTRR